jgi:hypothetical protein
MVVVTDHTAYLHSTVTGERIPFEMVGTVATSAVAAGM